MEGSWLLNGIHRIRTLGTFTGKLAPPRVNDDECRLRSNTAALGGVCNGRPATCRRHANTNLIPYTRNNLFGVCSCTN